MNKRKASADRNSRQKASSRRPSTSSLHVKSNMVQQKVYNPEKLASTHNLVEPKDSSKMVNKAVDACMPKTRFSSQDRCRDLRSYSSPRLKYFPAEKIKKLETPPPFSPKPIGALIAQQDPQESGVLYVTPHPEQRCDNGQGDARVAPQHLQHQQHQQHPGIYGASQQQVAPQQAIRRIGQMNPHSECTLPQQVPNIQSHRPFVPHGSRDYSPQKNSFQIPATLQSGIQQVQNSSRPVVEQGKIKNEDQIDASDIDYERQPVGGRNAAVYRKVITNKLQEHPFSQTAMDPAMLNQSNINNQLVFNQYPMNSHVSSPSNSQNPQNLQNLQNPQNLQNLQNLQNFQNFQNLQNSQNLQIPQNLQNSQNPQNPQQIYQQLQQNMMQQQQMQQRAMNYQMHAMGNQQQMEGGQGSLYNYNGQQLGRYFPGQGMTSPQDVTANQIKKSRMMGSIQQNYPIHQRDLDYTMNPQIRWTRNNQVAEYSSVKGQLKPYNLDVVNGNQPHYRAQNQQQQIVPQYQQRPASASAVHQHQYQQSYRNPEHVNAMVSRQQNPMAYNQPGHNQQMSLNRQSEPRHLLDINPETQNRKKKPPKYTVGMIRDQEKLLATMKQQGVPMDIMMRQFETLLNEQRRHLEYLEQIQQQEEFQEVRRPVAVPRRSKQKDEKPEWMVHLTPSRLSYVEIEKLHEKQRKERELQQLEVLHQQQQRMNEISGQQVPVQPTDQQNYQLWQQHNLQQQQGVQQYYNNVYSQPRVVSGPTNVNEPVNQTNYQQNMAQYRYAHHQPHQQYYNPQLQHYQQFYQTVLPKNQEQIQSSNHFPVYEENRPTTELSSLLKIRQYKNEIRPQKQNNGLQDPEEAKKLLENLRVPGETRKGLEYLVNLTPKKATVKLNGIQDRNEVEAEFQHRLIASTFQPPAKQVSANGLENSRNPNNPSQRLQRLSSLKKMEQEFLREYPRQKQNNPRNCYSVQAERENGTVAVEQPPMFVQQQFPEQNSIGVIPYNEKNPTMARGNVMPFRFEGNYAPHYQQMQQYYQNMKNLARYNGEGDIRSTQRIQQSKSNFDHAGGDASENMNGMMNGQVAEGKLPVQKMYYSQPDIHEARTIGGVRYLARKQDYLPNQQIVSPETLIASRHVQPPMIY